MFLGGQFGPSKTLGCKSACDTSKNGVGTVTSPTSLASSAATLWRHITGRCRTVGIVEDSTSAKVGTRGRLGSYCLTTTLPQFNDATLVRFKTNAIDKALNACTNKVMIRVNDHSSVKIDLKKYQEEKRKRSRRRNRQLIKIICKNEGER